MTQQAPRVAAIVVTCNRKALLGECLKALLAQTRRPDRIFVIDNASTDGTPEYLQQRGFLPSQTLTLTTLTENGGGAGGFHEGMRQAVETGMEWLWLMDDDARPEAGALQALLRTDRDPRNVYGSVAVHRSGDDEAICWPAVRPDRENAFQRGELQPVQEVHNIPFLGFFIHRDLVDAIGLPDRTYFILGDDMEYTERARTHGARLYLVRDSVVHHPMPRRHVFTLAGRTFYNLVLPPWKKYYDVRNRVFIGRTYHGTRCWTQTLPGLLVRMVDSLLHEPDRPRMLRAYALGIIDGLLGRRDRRVLPGP